MIAVVEFAAGGQGYPDRLDVLRADHIDVCEALIFRQIGATGHDGEIVPPAVG